MNHRLAGSLAAAAIALLALGAPVSAGSGGTHRVVDDDGKAGLFDDGTPNCSDAFDGTAAPFIGQIFSTISAAVTASSPGDTIFVCPGTYNESVTVDKTLTISGPQAGRNDITCKARKGQATVIGSGTGPAFALEANSISVSGLRIANTHGTGIWTSPSWAGYQITDNVIANNSVGVDLGSGGAAKTVVSGNCFVDNNNGAPGYGVHSTSLLGYAAIDGNAFWGHRGAGVAIGGAAAAQDISVNGNWSFDDKSFLVATTVLRVQVFKNRVAETDEISTPGSAIVVAGASDTVAVDQNHVDTNHTDGVLVKDTATNIYVRGNRIADVTNGVDITTTTVGGAHVRNNVIQDVQGSLSSIASGILLGATTSGNRIVNNKVLGVADLHCNDLSTGSGTAGTANNWHNNVGLISSPSGICHP